MPRYFLAFAALFASFSVFAAPLPISAPSPTSTLSLPMPSPPPTSAASYVLMSYQTGHIIAERDPHAHRAPASTTKMMTAYLVFQALAAGRIKLDTMFTVSKKAWQEPGSRMFIEPGKQISVNDLLQGMLIPSGNDAAMALAQGVAGTEAGFVSMMNAEAKKLGMVDTHYADPAGLDPADHVSAHDLAILARALIRDFPQYYHYFSQKKFTWNKITQYNWNKLLWMDPNVDGLKTGYTDKAGYCLVASAKRGDARMIAVVMGVPGLYDGDMSTKENLANYRHLAKVNESLLDYGFRFFATHEVYAAGKPLAKIRVWKGGKKWVEAGLARPLYVTAARGRLNHLEVKTQAKKTAPAPVTRGQPLGTVTVSFQGKTLATAPLVALAGVPEGGIWAKIRDTILGWF
ncbi:MAG: D-alanyl-D-alanine carboxypeptidase family protein [Gammaproteobacteria bacterium]